MPRTAGADKVTGRAIYVDDLEFPNMLHGATIRSTEPHAELLAIEWGDAVDWSGFTRVDATDIPGKNTIYLMEEDQPALADGVIRHCDEAVALIAGPTRAAVIEARRTIELKTRALEPVLTIEDSMRADNPIFGSDNIFKSIQMTKGDPTAALSSAPHVLEATYRVGYQEQMYIEPQGIIAVPEDDGGVTIYGSLQCPFYVVKALSPLLGLPKEKIRVIQCVTGGGFGGKEDYPSMISGHAALLALKAKRPVKIIYDRAEDIASTTKRHPAIIRHRTGFDDDGTLLAMDVQVRMDGGAYCTLSPVVISRTAIHATGPYKCENIRIDAIVSATHTPPNGAFRGFGAPQAAFAIERQVDAVAKAAGISPLDIRRRNLIRVGDETATGQVLTESVGSEACLETTVERSDYEARHKELGVQANSGPVRTGIGLSCFLHGAGFTGNGEVALAGKLDMAINEDGGVSIFTGSTDIGQGTRTVFPQLAADSLGISMDDVVMFEADTKSVPDSGPTVASRTLMVVGRLVEDASVQIVNLLRLELASKHGLEPAAVTFADGVFRWEDSERSFSEVARTVFETKGALRTRVEFQNRDNLDWDGDNYSGDAYPCYAWAAVVTEVEVDIDTYIPKVTRFTTAQDIGKAIHPLMVAGQIEGGSLQGIGWASMEELRIKNGRYVNHRMTDCIIPTALDAPEMDVTILEFPYKHGPHGAKGVGELPMDLPAAAVAAAMEQATGVVVDSAPFTPEMMCAALTEEAKP